MKISPLVAFFFISITLFSCKKDTLIEQVDVPATPIEVVKQKIGVSDPKEVKADVGIFKMFPLPFGYKDLEPHFDASSIEIHYSKHHLGCVNNLNKVIVGTKYEILKLTDILKNLSLFDTEVRNNAGGFYNHNFYWESISANAGGEPEGNLLDEIVKDFGSFELFRSQFTETSIKLMGSGWVWLVSDKSGKLKIVTTSNNDNPLMKNLGIYGIPILNIDMWEHAYYLKFQNRKREYVNTYFSVINWEEALKRYDAFPKVTVSSVVPVVTIEPTNPSEAKTE